jgi:hypothetical protein
MNHYQPPYRSVATRLLWSIAIAALALAATTAQAQTIPPLRKYVASPNYPAMFKEPTVQSQLQAAVGKQLPALMRNLNVSGEVEWIGGALSIHGNAPHQGGEEEGVVCVNEYNGAVEAAILSKGRITVFAKDNGYDTLMLCIKDWITQANSGHRDRMTQPKNVQFGKPN